MEKETNLLEIFGGENSATIRTEESETGQPLFCASDVARALGYSKPNNAVLRHCKNLVKKETKISGKIQAINFIEEPDIYRLVIRSKLPSAVKFEKMLFEDVLPSIRKHGMYLTEPTVQNILETENGVEIFRNAVTKFAEDFLSSHETG